MAETEVEAGCVGVWLVEHFQVPSLKYISGWAWCQSWVEWLTVNGHKDTWLIWFIEYETELFFLLWIFFFFQHFLRFHQLVKELCSFAFHLLTFRFEFCHNNLHVTSVWFNLININDFLLIWYDRLFCKFLLQFSKSLFKSLISIFDLSNLLWYIVLLTLRPFTKVCIFLSNRKQTFIDLPVVPIKVLQHAPAQLDAVRLFRQLFNDPLFALLEAAPVIFFLGKHIKI